jgi:hypothetical protein
MWKPGGMLDGLMIGLRMTGMYVKKRATHIHEGGIRK